MRSKSFTVTKTMLKGYDPEYIEKYAGKYYVREWDFGEKQDIIELSSEQEFDVETEKMKLKMKSSKYQILQMVTCIREAPKPVSEEYVRRMPNIVAKKLLDIVREVNEELDEDSDEGKT